MGKQKKKKFARWMNKIENLLDDIGREYPVLDNRLEGASLVLAAIMDDELGVAHRAKSGNVDLLRERCHYCGAILDRTKLH
ncbi:MAG: hypothetical protein KI785_15830 [Devosiaceae bacterium]|nr:hypothetical protein [Devosiaceae bacterium MH13]